MIQKFIELTWFVSILQITRLIISKDPSIRIQTSMTHKKRKNNVIPVDRNPQIH